MLTSGRLTDADGAPLTGPELRRRVRNAFRHDAGPRPVVLANGAPTFCDRLRDASRTIWERQLEHPFLRALCDGSLPNEVFSFYICQDARFLDELAKAFAYAATKTSSQDEMQQFGERLLHTLAVEKVLHQSTRGALA
jgi:thiaminase/transcriptional activator TenA